MFKKFLAYLLIISLLLPALPVQAEGIYKMVGSGAVTQANMKISAVAGTAFIDFSDSEAAANKLINHKGYLLKIRDSSKRAIQGYVKEAGTGETLDVDVFGGEGNFSTDANWTKNAGWTIVANEAVATAAASLQLIYLTAVPTRVSGALYKSTWDIVSCPSGAIRMNGIFAGSPSYSSGAITSYGTQTSVSVFVGFQSIGETTAVCDNLITKKVLTPSATGVTIASTKGGSTFNFAALDSAFDYNDSSGYTYELWQVNNAVEVASGSIAAGEMLADTTATNAFVAPVGVNLSAYQTGKYIFAAYNTVGGYAAFGYIKGTAPGGETLSEKVVNGDMELDSSWPNYGSPTSNTRSDEQADSGTYSRKIVGNSGNGASQLVTIDSGSLVVALGKIYAGSGTGRINFKNGLDTVSYTLKDSSAASWVSSDATYFTLSSSNSRIAIESRSTGGTIYFDNISLKQVTDCAATGALIVSAKDGATRSWSYKNALFNPNIASTFKIFFVGD